MKMKLDKKKWGYVGSGPIEQSSEIFHQIRQLICSQQLPLWGSPVWVQGKGHIVFHPDRFPQLATWKPNITKLQK